MLKRFRRVSFNFQKRFQTYKLRVDVDSTGRIWKSRIRQPFKEEDERQRGHLLTQQIWSILGPNGYHRLLHLEPGDQEST